MIASRSVSSSPSNTVERFGDRQVDVVGDRPPLHLHRQALRLQPLAVARRARTQRRGTARAPPARPSCPPRSGAAGSAAALRTPCPAPNSSTSRAFRGSLRERHVQIDAEVARQRLQRLAAPACGRPAPTARSRRRPATSISSGTTRCGSKSIDRAEPLAVGARAVRRVEREGARRHLGHAQAAVDAGQPPREQPIAAVERVDDDDVVGEIERDVDRFGQPPLDAAADDHAIDDHLDGVVAAPIELDVLFERAELAVDARLGEAARAQRRRAPS